MNGHDINWMRMCVAVNGFRARYRIWPTRVRLPAAYLSNLRDDVFTAAGFALVTAKIELVVDETAPIIAEDDDGHQFNYDHDKSDGESDIQAQDWFGHPEIRSDGIDTAIYVNGKRVYPTVKAERVRYIKLGREGCWEKECAEKGIIRYGYGSATAERFPLCRERRWSDLTKSYIASGKGKGTATRFTNETRLFFEDDGSTLWITFIGERLLWGFLTKDPAEPHKPAEPNQTGDGVFRRVADGWRSTDRNGQELTKGGLSGELNKLAAYRGTSCQVRLKDYVVRRINGQKTPEVERGIAAFEEMKASVLEMMKLLGWKDFETLVDLVFSTSGWRRQGPVGGTEKIRDLDLVLPSTDEHAFVQVKSETNATELAGYVAKFHELEIYHRMFFVHHSDKNVETDDDEVTVIGPEKLAVMVVDAGLVTWLIRKVS